MNIKSTFTSTLIICTIIFTNTLHAERIKDISSFAGVRTNQLLGYGLVVGLDGTGDQTSQTPFTIQSLKSFLKQYGVTIPPDINPQLKNVAAVTVHAELAPFAKPGQNIDITVSSLGNAKSLRGGSLLITPLRGIDGQVYAIAQVIVNSRTGKVVIGSNVSVTPAAVTHGSLAVTITSDPLVSQPNEFSQGETVVVDRTNIEVEQEANRMFVFGPGVTLNEIVNAVNQVGAAPGDLVAILEALKQAGALRAELVII